MLSCSGSWLYTLSCSAPTAHTPYLHPAAGTSQWLPRALVFKPRLLQASGLFAGRGCAEGKASHCSFQPGAPMHGHTIPSRRQT